MQREVAAKLEVDTAYVSKMENGTKQVSRSWLPILADMFKVHEDDLVTLWIADKALLLLQDEPLALKALSLISEKLQRNNSKEV